MRQAYSLIILTGLIFIILTLLHIYRLLEFLGMGTVENRHIDMIREVVLEMCCQFMDMPYSSRKFATWAEAIKFYRECVSRCYG